VATQSKTRAARTAARTPASGDGNGAVIAAADLEPLLDALRAAARGEAVPRLDARKRLAKTHAL